MSFFSSEDLKKIKDLISPSDIMSFLEEQGGEPRYMNDSIIVSNTICHGGNSKKLYYYINSKNFHCYTNCGSFDIFHLVQTLFGLNFIRSIQYVVNKFNINLGFFEEVDFDGSSSLRKKEEAYLSAIKQLNEKTVDNQEINLKIYDDKILTRFMYPIIKPWEREGISREVMKEAAIGYYPGGGQITIPHYNKNGELVGIRGRQLGAEEANMFGKYRPLYINKILYNHPLGFNLYNLNNSKDNIKTLQKCFVFESEKSCLMYRTYFGKENDISVACCGSSLTDHQVQLLLEAGAREIIVAFDRQFQEIGDEEFEKLTKKLTALNKKYKNIVSISFLFDKNKITAYKSSPIDEGPLKFLELYKERIIL